ncbi:hypothetical protein FHR32_008824 [Streptosporangium album]|uniref:Uncharacterized protein n=1 Tax=Streptosporangium album TaxID=47479 RepID=A0A7W7S5T6_9ACTN|nr:hypothetical protein [Streptosporangium album]MBB4944418.1 hypothetical protein [Streptosporangium album]
MHSSCAGPGVGYPERLAMHQMTRHPTREPAGQPPHGRWEDPPALPTLSSPDRRGKVLELLAAQPWKAWKGAEPGGRRARGASGA